MHITIVDGPPGIGVSRGLKEMSVNHGYDTTMIIPEFANVAMKDQKLRNTNLTWVLTESIQKFVQAIGDAEKQGVNSLILGGSPVSYRSLARVRKGNHIDAGILKQYKEIMKATANYTDIVLMKPAEGSDYDPEKVKVIPPNSIPRFIRALDQEYESLFSNVTTLEIRNIQSI